MRCPREGRRVRFAPNPVSHAMYSRAYCLPKPGEAGTVTTVPLPGGRKTCMPGPGGGLVYVKWDGGCTVGVAPQDLARGKKGGLAGPRRRRRKRK